MSHLNHSPCYLVLTDHGLVLSCLCGAGESPVGVSEQPGLLCRFDQ